MAVAARGGRSEGGRRRRRGWRTRCQRRCRLLRLWPSAGPSGELEGRSWFREGKGAEERADGRARSEQATLATWGGAGTERGPRGMRPDGVRSSGGGAGCRRGRGGRRRGSCGCWLAVRGGRREQSRWQPSTLTLACRPHPTESPSSPDASRSTSLSVHRVALSKRSYRPCSQQRTSPAGRQPLVHSASQTPHRPPPLRPVPPIRHQASCRCRPWASCPACRRRSASALRLRGRTSRCRRASGRACAASRLASTGEGRMDSRAPPR